MTKIVFKGDFQNQNLILPPSLDELIPQVHPVRVISHIVDCLNISDLLSEYKGGGASSFHPRMLLKVLIYAYLNNIYSSRKIEKQLYENIHFMWLSGFSKQISGQSTISEERDWLGNLILFSHRL